MVRRWIVAISASTRQQKQAGDGIGDRKGNTMKITLFGWELIIKPVDRLSIENVMKLASTYSHCPNKIHCIRAVRALTHPAMPLRDAKIWVDHHIAL